MLRETRKQDTKEHIFMQAIQLFKEKGYEGVTVQEIATACGIAKGTFFNYFSKKEELLLYLGESQLQLLDQNSKNYREIEDPKTKISALLGGLLKRYSEEGDLMKLVVSELVRSAFLAEMESNSIRKLQQMLMDIVNEAKQSGKLQSNQDTELIASAVVGAYFHTMMTWTLLNAESSSIVDRFEQHLDVVWHGICPKGEQ
ncbi:MAG TPA: TetR/AcrR family transcriptional regulator [Candidatus Paenibacillus intestinavium]|nr:TetR/AcrR family transcriptional regulator [Candidatus Paenibacillus intestinavium]